MKSAIRGASFNFFRLEVRVPSSGELQRSAIENFETCIFLIGLNRFSHALASCAAAIENLMALNPDVPVKDSSRSPNAETLYKYARRRESISSVVEQAEKIGFRDQRNKIIHRGLSIADDELAANLLLRIGFRLLHACFVEFLNFDLRNSLLPKVEMHLRVAENSYARQMSESVRAVHYLQSLSHLVRHLIRESCLSGAELAILDHADGDGRISDELHKGLHRLELRFENAHRFRCPVCGAFESFAASIDPDHLDRGIVAVIEGTCVSCDLNVLPQALGLAHGLCQDEIDKQRTSILRAYGIDIMVGERQR